MGPAKLSQSGGSSSEEQLDQAHRTLPCRFCSRRFTHEAEEIIHARMQHYQPEKGMKLCQVCGDVMKDVHELGEHMFTAHNAFPWIKRRPKRTCTTRKGQFQPKIQLPELKILKVQLNRLAPNFKCEACLQFSTYEKEHFKEHIYDVHAPISPDFPLKQFISKSILSNKEANATPMIIPDEVSKQITRPGDGLVCLFCLNFTTSQEDEMSNHLSEIHEAKIKKGFTFAELSAKEASNEDIDIAPVALDGPKLRCLKCNKFRNRSSMQGLKQHLTKLHRKGLKPVESVNFAYEESEMSSSMKEIQASKSSIHSCGNIGAIQQSTASEESQDNVNSDAEVDKILEHSLGPDSDMDLHQNSVQGQEANQDMEQDLSQKAGQDLDQGLNKNSDQDLGLDVALDPDKMLDKESANGSPNEVSQTSAPATAFKSMILDHEVDCFFCSFQTSNLHEMVAHQNKEHVIKTEWECGICGHPAQTMAECDAHAVMKHFSWEEMMFPCPECFYKANLFKVLEKHYINKHRAPGRLKWKNQRLISIQ